MGALAALLHEPDAPAIAAKDGAAAALAAAMRRDSAGRAVRDKATRVLGRVLAAGPAGLSGVYEALQLVLQDHPAVDGKLDEIATLATERLKDVPVPKTPRDIADADD